MNPGTPISEKRAISIATTYLQKEGWLDRVIPDKARAIFLDSAEGRAEEEKKRPHLSIPPLKDKWSIVFPLVHPVAETGTTDRYVLVDAHTGDARMGL